MRPKLSILIRSLPLPLTVLVLVSGGCDTLGSMGDFGGRVHDLITGHTARNAAVQMEDQYFPDERRQGINALSDRDFGRHEPYTKRYEQIAATDSDYLVRATAIRALNRSRWKHATPLFIKALDDQNDHVRLEAAKALANVPDENAVPSLVKLVGDPGEQRDVRIAAADALHHYATVEVERTLVGQLGGKEFGVAWQSLKSLRMLTGQNLFYNESAWLQYITGSGKPLG